LTPKIPMFAVSAIVRFASCFRGFRSSLNELRWHRRSGGQSVPFHLPCIVYYPWSRHFVHTIWGFFENNEPNQRSSIDSFSSCVHWRGRGYSRRGCHPLRTADHGCKNRGI